MPSRPNYEQLYASFRWNIPARYNIAADVCDRHAGDPGKVAMIGEDSDGKTWTDDLPRGAAEGQPVGQSSCCRSASSKATG